VLFHFFYSEYLECSVPSTILLNSGVSDFYLCCSSSSYSSFFFSPWMIAELKSELGKDLSCARDSFSLILWGDYNDSLDSLIVGSFLDLSEPSDSSDEFSLLP
jgi:hypothetical protein